MRLSGNVAGALLMMASMASFTINDTLIKAMAGDVPLNQILFLRGVLTSAMVGAAAWRMGNLYARLSRRDWILVVIRTMAETAAAYFFLTALFHMPIANVTAILQALPLIVTLAAVFFFGEHVGWRRMIAILLGLAGVMLIIRPASDDFNFHSLYALVAVFCVALRDLSTRRLSRRVSTMFVTLFTSVSMTAFFGFAGLGTDWVPMGTREISLTSAASIMIMCAYLFSIMVMRVGEVSFVAPFRYTGLLWAMLLGWLVFNEWPDNVTLLGAAILVGSGLFAFYRETSLGLARRNRAR